MPIYGHMTTWGVAQALIGCVEEAPEQWIDHPSVARGHRILTTRVVSEDVRWVSEGVGNNRPVQGQRILTTRDR